MISFLRAFVQDGWIMLVFIGFLLWVVWQGSI